MRAVLVWLSMLVIAACGDDGRQTPIDGGSPDAAEVAPPDARLDPPDAAIDAGPLALPDVSGDALISVRPDLPDDLLVRFRATFVLGADGDGALLDVTATALDVDDSTPVGAAFVVNDVAVAADGTFEVELVGTLVAAANPVSGTDVALDAVLHGTIVDADATCGTVTGTAGALPLDGSTYASVRIVDALPEPVFACAAP